MWNLAKRYRGLHLFDDMIKRNNRIVMQTVHPVTCSHQSNQIWLNNKKQEGGYEDENSSEKFQPKLKIRKKCYLILSVADHKTKILYAWYEILSEQTINFLAIGFLNSIWKWQPLRFSIEIVHSIQTRQTVNCQYIEMFNCIGHLSVALQRASQVHTHPFLNNNNDSYYYLQWFHPILYIPGLVQDFQQQRFF